MSKGIYFGYSTAAKKVKKIYFGGDNGVAKKVKKGYIGDSDGKARLFFTQELTMEEMRSEGLIKSSNGLILMGESQNNDGDECSGILDFKEQNYYSSIGNDINNSFEMTKVDIKGDCILSSFKWKVANVSKVTKMTFCFICPSSSDADIVAESIKAKYTKIVSHRYTVSNGSVLKNTQTWNLDTVTNAGLTSNYSYTYGDLSYSFSSLSGYVVEITSTNSKYCPSFAYNSGVSSAGKYNYIFEFK